MWFKRAISFVLLSCFGTIEFRELLQAQHRQAVGVESLIQLLVLGQTGCSGCGWKAPLEVCGDTELELVVDVVGVAFGSWFQSCQQVLTHFLLLGVTDQPLGLCILFKGRVLYLVGMEEPSLSPIMVDRLIKHR